MTGVNHSITVIGAGVVGLSSAIRLAEAGYSVDVLAKELPLETVSATAGGVWMPFLAEPAMAVARWSLLTFEVLFDLAEGGASGLPGDEGSSIGVILRDGYLLDNEPEPPAWTTGSPRLTARKTLDPTPKHKQGWGLQVPIVDMKLYLPYLVRRLEAAGGKITQRSLSALPTQGLVVNCTGLGARTLVEDESVHPIRGQVVLVDNPGVTTWLSDDTDLSRVTYVIPHARHIVVGGTVEPHEWSMTPDPTVATNILDRASDLIPELRSASILSHKVGLRPGRPAIRLETVRGPEGTVVHCYGHGGSGITVSWGCADDVLAAVNTVTATPSPPLARHPAIPPG